MDSIDRLLAELQAEHETSPENKRPEPQSVQNPSEGSLNEQGYRDRTIDSLLAQVENEYRAVPSQQSSPSQQPLPAQSRPLGLKGNLDNLLNEVKSDLEERDRVEELKRQQQEQEEALRREQLKRQQYEVLEKQAQKWLKALDPYSDEGFWFEQFAQNYPSKLEAAIAYLQAMQPENNK